jgi:hypothetical protein
MSFGLDRPVISDGRAGNPRALMVGTASGALAATKPKRG